MLVVDDHPSFRRFARKLLEAAGFAVVEEAADGASALAAVRALRPDVVLLDVLLVVLTSSRSPADLEPSLSRSSARGFIAKRDLTVAAFAALVGGAA